MKKAAKRLPASRCFSAVTWASPTVIVMRAVGRPALDAASVEPSAQFASPVIAPFS